MWSLCHEVQSKVFLNPKKGTLYHKFGSNEKANTPGLHLLWGILMNYAKWKANKKISQFILRKMILAQNKKCYRLLCQTTHQNLQVFVEKNWNITWAWIWKPCRENVLYNKTKCIRSRSNGILTRERPSWFFSKNEHFFWKVL